MNSQIMVNGYIENELKKFNVTDAAIDQLKKDYLPLKIHGIDDKEGYQKVYAARQLVKSKRIEVEKMRKELKEDSLKFQRAIDAEAKRITNLLAPIEEHLANEEKVIDAEKERIKQEKERLEAELIQSRVKRLLSVGFIFDGVHYLNTNIESKTKSFSLLILKTMHADQFDHEFKRLHSEFEIKQEQLRRIEEEKKAEAERVEQERIAELKRKEEELQKERAEFERAEQERRAELVRIEKERIAEREELERQLHEQKEKARIAEEVAKKLKEAEQEKPHLCSKIMNPENVGLDQAKHGNDEPTNLICRSCGCSIDPNICESCINYADETDG